MARKKVAYIISDIEKALAFEWTALYLAPRVDLFFVVIGKDNTPICQYLYSINVSFTVITDREYSTVVAKWVRLFKVLKGYKPDIVHIHLWRAMIFGLTVSWILRIKKRIFTRHHATLHYSEYPSGRKWDKLFNFLATDIVAISENVATILKLRDKALPNKVHVIHHGFDLEYFKNVSEQRVYTIKRKYGLSEVTGPIIGVISRYLKLKGILYIIKAFQELKSYFPGAHLILANACGDYSSAIKDELKNLPSQSYTEIVFENDLAALYKVFDVFVHVPIDVHSEAFGQTYVEALAAGVPSVFTLSGVASEFIENGKNALVADYKDKEEIFLCVKKILEHKDIRLMLISNGWRSVKAKFNIGQMIDKLLTLYEVDIQDH